MKCGSCGHESEAAGEFCPRCGVRTSTTMPPLRGASTKTGPNRAMVGVSIVAIAALALAAYFGWRAFAPSGEVVKAVGNQAPVGPLTESAGKVAPTAPIATAQGTTTPEPTEVIDYLKFLKDIERRRVLTAKSQMAELLKQSGALTLAGGMADWTTNEPEKKYQEVYGKFQQSLAQWTTQWQELTAAFLAYPRAVPASCQTLRDRYYAMLGATSAAMMRVGMSFSDALSGDPSKAIDALTQMQGSGLGSASQEIREACDQADQELTSVCEKNKIRKDFDIRDDLGGGNLLGR